MVEKAHIFGKEGFKPGDWVWCQHCERCYQAGEYRLEKGGLQMCPYPGCSGDTFIDSWAWSGLREAHPDYPEVPERDKVYPQFG